MPFTISHIAAVLPVRSRRLWLDALPTAPLVAGSMVPDLPAIVGDPHLRSATHDIPAALTLDVALVVVTVAIWRWGLRPLVARCVPALEARWRPSPASWRRWQNWLWWYVAAAGGAITHVVWDALTHSEGAGGGWLHWLGGGGPSTHFFLALQVASSVLGLAILLRWSQLWWRRSAPSRKAEPPVRALPTVVTTLVVLLVTAASTVSRGISWPEIRAGNLRAGLIVGDGAFGALNGLLVSGVVLALGYAVFRLARRAVSAVSSRRSARSRVPSRPK